MNSYYRLILLGLLYLVFTIPVHGQEEGCLGVRSMYELSYEEFDSLSLSACSMNDFVRLVGAAQFIIIDTAMDAQIQASIWLGLITKEVQHRINNKKISPNDPNVQYLINQLEREKYLISIRPSDWAKLLHYIQEGRWQYISRRFVDRGVHIILIVLLVFLAVGYYSIRTMKRKRKES